MLMNSSNDASIDVERVPAIAARTGGGERTAMAKPAAKAARRAKTAPMDPLDGGERQPDPYRTRLKVRMLQIAERLLETEGLAGLQARRVAVEADCSVGTIYNIFEGLDGLVLAANAQTLRAFGRAAEAATRRTEDQDVEAQLLALALAYLDFAVTHRMRLRAVFDHHMAGGADVPAPYLADQARLFALIEKPLARSIPDAATRSLMARAMFSAVHGVVIMALDRKLSAFDAIETERQVRFIVEAMARGLPHTTAAGSTH